MVTSDLFQRSLDAAISFVGMTRERAEVIVKEWVEAGDLGKERAMKAVDDLIDRSQRASEELRNVVRREIADQMTALGAATRDDLARLEAKIDALVASKGGDDAGPPQAEGP